MGFADSLAHHFHNQNFLFAVSVLAFEAVMVIFYAVGTTYDPVDVDPLSVEQNTNAIGTVTRYYGFFQDVHVMIFVGFGFLMTFTKRNAMNSVGLNFMAAALAIQWSILVKAFLEGAYTQTIEVIPLNIVSLINGDFCAASILITYGAVLGKITPFQLVLVVFFEVIFWGILDFIVFKIFFAIDMGGSMVIHAFGAYFGLALTFMITKRDKARAHPENSPSYQGDLLAMIGTVFLWMYWPSFNGALALGAQQHRVIVNTLLSICASCVAAFACSALFRPHHKFSMVDIQNATLAGGVAVGSSADLVILPWGAFLIGLVAGTISTLGFTYLTPLLDKHLGIHDTCGVHNLHGMPGIMGGVAGAIGAALAPENLYGSNIWLIFPARMPEADGGWGRSAASQCGFQFAALAVSVLLGIAGGLFTGAIVRWNNFGNQKHEYFEDDPFWEVAEGQPPRKEEPNGNGNHHEVEMDQGHLKV